VAYVRFPIKPPAYAYPSRVCGLWQDPRGPAHAGRQEQRSHEREAPKAGFPFFSPPRCHGIMYVPPGRDYGHRVGVPRLPGVAM